MKPLIFLFISQFFLSTFSLAQGLKVGNGGIGLRCSFNYITSTISTETVILYDLAEVEILGARIDLYRKPYSIANTFDQLGYEKSKNFNIYLERISQLTNDQFLFEIVYNFFSASTRNNQNDIKIIKNFKSEFDFETLSDIKDQIIRYSRFYGIECAEEPVQLAIRYSGAASKDQYYFSRLIYDMNSWDLSALYLHEALHKYFSSSSTASCAKCVRQLVGYLSADKKFRVINKTIMLKILADRMPYSFLSTH